MKNWTILTLFFVISFFSCVTSKNDNFRNEQDSLSVLEKTIISASEVISEKLPKNAKIAFFNNSSEQTELTNFIIEQLQDIMVKKGEFIITEMKNIETLEAVHKWQMETGYVSDDEIASITRKIGAQYVVSCIISGSGALERLRFKAWHLESGQILASNSFPINDIAKAKIIEVKGEVKDNIELLSIRRNGITVDYCVSYENDSYEFSFEIYIDGTQHWFMTVINYSYDEEYTTVGVLTLNCNNNKTNYYAASYYGKSYIWSAPEIFNEANVEIRDINRIQDILNEIIDISIKT